MVDRFSDFSHGFVVRYDTTSFHVGKAAIDAFDDFHLAGYESLDGFACEEGLCAPCGMREPTEIMLGAG